MVNYAVFSRQGTNGQNGLSAYEIWLSQGNTGTQQDFLNSLQGAAGTNANSPIFNAPITILDVVGGQVSQGSTFNVNIANYLNFNVSSVILNVEFKGQIGAPGSIAADVNAQCGSNIFKIGRWNQAIYSSSHQIIDLNQIILPVINNQIIFSTPIWIFGESLKIEILGYFI